jgi:hypothetical protein
MAHASGTWDSLLPELVNKILEIHRVQVNAAGLQEVLSLAGAGL